MATTIKNAIRSLNELSERLQYTNRFIAQHSADWMELLREVTEKHGRAMQPEIADQDEWIAFVTGLSDRVFRLVDIDKLVIFSVENFVTIEDISKKMVEDWVRAGLDGLPGGKEITDDETGNPEPIAEKVYQIIRSRSAGEWNTLREFTQMRLTGHGEEMLPELLEIWVTELHARVREDWIEWVRGEARESFRKGTFSRKGKTIPGDDPF